MATNLSVRNGWIADIRPIGQTVLMEPHKPPIPVHSAVRNWLFPFFGVQQVTVLVLITLACALFGLAMRDWFAFAFTYSVGFIIFAFQMRRFVPYELSVPDAILPRLVENLNKLGFLWKQSEVLVWDRKGVLATQLDSIRITGSEGNWCMRGRRADILGVYSLFDRWVREES